MVPGWAVVGIIFRIGWKPCPRGISVNILLVLFWRAGPSVSQDLWRVEPNEWLAKERISRAATSMRKEQGGNKGEMKGQIRTQLRPVLLSSFSERKENLFRREENEYMKDK